MKTCTAILIFCALTFSMNVQGQNGNTDGTYTGETGFNITEGEGSEGGNCGNGPHPHAGNANCPGGSTSIPLDGGLSILLLGAAAFGIKKLRDNRKQII
jgi:hypothetical protein